MLHLANLLTLALIALNLVGLGLAVRRITRLPFGVALSAGTLALVLVFFFLEHIAGLGRLLWLLPFTSVFASASIWMSRRDFRDWRGGLLAFLAGFGYALLWRYFFPNIDPSSEKIADLSFVAAYLPGETLPPTDPWLPPFRFTQYYSIQHYGAALLGRLLDQPAGAAYNLGYCALVGLIIAPVWEFGKSFGLGLVRRAALFLTLLVGGSGAALVVPFMLKDFWQAETLWDTMRFAGCTTASAPERFTGFGLRIRELGHIPDNPEANLDLPMEIFSYVVQLGDFHAPLGGFLMLTLSLAAFGLLLNGKNSAGAGVVLGLCVVTTLAANTWIFPLQVLLLLAFAAHLAFLAKPGVWPDPPALALPGFRRRLLTRSAAGVAAGVAVAVLLLYPFFSRFLAAGAGSSQTFASSLSCPAGLRIGDVLVAVNGERPSSPANLEKYAGKSAVEKDRFISLRVQRGPGRFENGIKVFDERELPMSLGEMENWFGRTYDLIAAEPIPRVPVRFPLLTPLPYWLIIFWPVAGLIVLCVYTRDPSRKAFAWWGVFWMCALIGTELFYFNDDYGGHFERFNSTLKWWPWAFAGAVLSLGALHLSSGRPFRRSAAFLLMGGMLFYVVALGRTWAALDKSSAGRLDGTAWFRRTERPGANEDEIKRERTRSNALLTFLAAQNPSVIVEPFFDDLVPGGGRVPRMAFCETGYLALASGHQVVLGWASHQQLWRNYNKEVETRLNSIRGLYQGKLPNPVSWLAEHHVRYVYWPDFQDDPRGEIWERVKTMLEPAYRWHSFDPASPRYGLFIRVD